jgi:rod shape-determining protein MreD
VSVWTLSRIDIALRSVTPFFMSLVLILLGAMPIAMPLDWPLAPGFGLMAVFYWSVYRPDLLPALAVFALGLLQDLISGAPVGITAVIYLGTFALVLNQRKIFLGKPFALSWWGFSVVAIAAEATRWLLSSVLAGRLLDVHRVGGELGATILLFPLSVWLFVLTHRRILPQVAG